MSQAPLTAISVALEATSDFVAPEPVRVAVLWRSLPGYVSRCVSALARYKNVQVFVSYQDEGAFPNEVAHLKEHPQLLVVEPQNPAEVMSAGLAFRPQVAVISLTRTGLFRRLASAWKKAGALVIGACDHYWKGDWRDYANVLAAKTGVFSPYEALLVPGALAKTYATRLGFPDSAVFDGMYSCDTDLFRPIGERRHLNQRGEEWPPVFLFVGQFIRRKGIDILLQAYQSYRQQVQEPWELWLVGQGELAPRLEGLPGVRNLGMKSSLEIAALMGQAGCLVLPSRVDHWGLVIHEGICAGLPILASNRCGAGVELVQAGFNGYVYPWQEAEILARLLRFMAENGRAREMGRNSLDLSRRFSPELWAQRILVDIPLFRRGIPFLKYHWEQ